MLHKSGDLNSFPQMSIQRESQTQYSKIFIQGVLEAYCAHMPTFTQRHNDDDNNIVIMLIINLKIKLAVNW